MRFRTEAVVSILCTLGVAATGFFGNIYLIATLPSSDFVKYGFAISLTGLIADAAYTWQKNSAVALSGCKEDALDKISGVDSILLLISVLAFGVVVVVGLATGQAVLFALSLGFATVFDGIFSFKVGLLRASGQKLRSYFSTLASALVRWAILLTFAPRLGLEVAFGFTLPMKAVFLSWVVFHTQSAIATSRSQRQIHRNKFFGLARGFVVMGVSYAVFSQIDKVIISGFGSLPPTLAKQFIFESIFGAQIVSLFSSSLSIVTYPRLVKAMDKKMNLKFEFKRSLAVNIFVGLLVSIAVWAMLTFIYNPEIVNLNFSTTSAIFWFGVSQALLSAAIVAQTPTVLLNKGQHTSFVIFGAGSVLYFFTVAVFNQLDTYTWIPLAKTIILTAVTGMLIRNTLIAIDASESRN